MPTTTSPEKEIEELREANHRLKLNMDSMKQSLQNEVEYLKDELQIKDKDLLAAQEKLKIQSKRKETDSEDKFASLNEAYSLIRDENLDLKNQMQGLHKTIEQMRTSQADRHTYHEDNEALKVTIDRLNIDLSNTRELLEKQQSKVHDLMQESIKQTGLLTDLREQMESRDGYISELQSRIKDLEKDKQEAIMELQHTVMMQQTAQQDVDDPNRRGNSLFSEVEERRVRVEEELNRLRARVARLSTENYELQSTIQKGDSRSAIILQQLQVMHRSEIDVVQELKKAISETSPVFNQYRDKFENLKEEYKKKLMRYRDGENTPMVGELESIRSERDLLIMQKMALEQELFEKKAELEYAKQQLKEGEAKCKIFRTKYQALQEEIMSGTNKLKPESDGNANSTMLDSSFNKTLFGIDGSTGTEINSSKKWLYDTIINETINAGSGILTPPAANSRKVKSNDIAPGTAKKPHPETEEIAECKQQ